MMVVRLVVALDLGTTYSGYAFSASSDPLTIVSNVWNSGSGQLMSSKSPTCVLLHNDMFHSFGYDAENKYVQVIDDEDRNDWRLFRRFKMVLHKQATLSRSTTTIADTRGDYMEAFPIFTMALGYLKKSALEHIKKQRGEVSMENVTFVITVPAIWDDNAKQFMREAATEAGIDTSKLKFALEPEAASIWCESHSAEASIALAGTGTRYMVVDLGGGTADISVHERNEDGTLREIHRASGGNWGGTNVDAKFIELLQDLFGREILHAWKRDNQDDYMELLRTFEAEKLAFGPDLDTKLTLEVPESLFDSTTLDLTRYEDKIEVKPYKLRFETKNFGTIFFDDLITKIVNHLKKLFEKSGLEFVQTIVLVGGFAECRYLQVKVKAEFSEKRLIVPDDPGMSVLKGAVKYGHFPLIVTSRIMRYTYGIEARRKFDERIHKHIKPVYNQEANCHVVEKCFQMFVPVDKEIKTDSKFTQTFKTFYGCNETHINIFRSPQKAPSMVTDPECVKVGTVKIRHSKEPFKIYVTFMFGKTELIVKARIQETGKEAIVKLDCLNDTHL
ncbi:HS12B-like protein [Mya arenaria]|uniref:HS12B-like protein n=1 Tax=Mya arenaria TaxID=6604 RepID=A0ABY7GBN9_MYAAR|nr:heat shock 70 kDa protein 12A-like [Mya arenaria]WAR31337.1 HS12B-like protein [Mya arenaria]